MPKYRKKPIVIEARQLPATDEAGQEAVANWCHGKLRGMAYEPSKRFVQIETLEGEMTADTGDFIIKGIQGEFYPCKPEIFVATYEQVE